MKIENNCVDSIHTRDMKIGDTGIVVTHPSNYYNYVLTKVGERCWVVIGKVGEDVPPAYFDHEPNYRVQLVTAKLVIE